jgi:hypothetical protein
MTGFEARASLAVGVLASLVLAAGATAQPKPEARAAVVQRLIDCRKLTDAAQRLACFDAAAGALDQAEAKGDIVVVDREQARTVRRQAFGFRMPSITLFERGEKPEEVQNVTGKVAAARQNAAGKWVIKLEDGATWSQVDTTEVVRDPKAGMPVKIRAAAMGSYLLSLDGQRAFRAHRDE